MDRRKFINSLKKRYSLRLHMALILMATSMAGVLASKGMLAIGLHNVAIRFPISVLCAYLVFFVAIKVWIWLMTDRTVSSSNSCNSRNRGSTVLNGIDLPIPSWGSSEASFSGGGGTFGGGGASGDFGEVLGEAASGTGDAVKGVGEVVGDVAGAVDDDGIAVVIVVGLLAILLFAVLGAGTLLIWHAPTILAEAAFDAVLAASC